MNEEYLGWLYPQVVPPRVKREYWQLLGLLQAKEFVWFIPNDDNRLMDGLDIRFEFFRKDHVFEEDASVLEVIVGISRRMAFILNGEPYKWAWELIRNLELNHMSDPIGNRRRAKIDDILDTLVWRTYNRDGTDGGFFPVAFHEADQRKVEIWYQMHAYIEEMHDQ